MDREDSIPTGRWAARKGREGGPPGSKIRAETSMKEVMGSFAR
jgi:hypothetical protein